MCNVRIIIRMVRMFLHSCRVSSRVLKRFPNVSIESNVIFKGDVSNLELGDNVHIQSGVVLHMGGMDWCEFAGCICIGDDSIISPNCIIYGCGPGGVHIGKRFDCGPNVSIFSSRTDYTKNLKTHIFESVHIGNDVTVFANAVISPGVSIGTGAVVAAGSVVLNDIPDNVMVAGAPAKIVRRNIKKSVNIYENY